MSPLSAFLGMAVRQVTTPTLEIAYLEGGPPDGDPLLLLHGWPDDPLTYEHVAPILHEAGFRTVAPWLRGFGRTRFRSAGTLRSGQMAAIAQDMLDFTDALSLSRFSVVGHDWGARVAYILGSVFPERVGRLAAMSVGWEPGNPATPSYEQARRFWYQWFMATERGADVIRRDGIAFARAQWETWSPPGWFDAEDFEATAESFSNPDWPEVTLHSYRERWGEAPPDPNYEQLELTRKTAREIKVPTLVIHGAEDRCVLPSASLGKEKHFNGGYRHRMLDGVGHFPTREAPEEVGPLLVEFLQQPGAGRTRRSA